MMHFVGFKDPRYAKDERYWRAAQIFGEPDFIHRNWDVRAKQEVVPGDVAVFAAGTERDEPWANAFDDSAHL